jgi:hypothetical protein
MTINPSNDPDPDILYASGSWRALTTVEQKYQQFSAECYFRESWDTVVRALTNKTLHSLQRIAMLVVKPEAVLGRKGKDIFDYMEQHGFEAIVAHPFRYDRHKAREIWRFQWNIATLDRLQLGDLLHGSADALIVLFADERRELGIPGSVRLAGLKGSSLPWERNSQHLRTHLGALNRMVVFVHCSDEPIDIVRELGILLHPAELRDVYGRVAAALNGRRFDDIDSAVNTLYARFPAQPLDILNAVKRIRTGLADAGVREAPAAQQADTALAAALDGKKLEWREWSSQIEAAGRNPAGWDEVLVATHYIQHDKPGVRCIISESGREGWLAGAALMAYL